MAGVIGSSGGGFATVNPTQGNPMSDALQNVENSAFRYRAEKREGDQIRAQQARQLQDDRRKDFDESAKFSKENPFIATGTGLDAVNRQSYMNAKKAASEAYSQYMKTGDDKFKAIHENAIASVSNLSSIPTQINTLKEDWVKNAKDYNPESLKRKAALLDQIASGQIVQSNDENGNPSYTVFDKDEQGNINKLSYKNLNGNQLVKLLNPEKSFNVDGKDGFIDLFNKNIGKERKVIIGKGLNAVEKTYNPGAEDLAKIMAEDAVQDRSKMYETLSRMGLDPEDDKNYSDPKVTDEATKYLQKMLMVTAPTTESAKPDTSLETLALARTREYNDEKQRKVDNAFKNKEFQLKEIDKNTVTVGTTEYKFTDIGTKAKKDFYADPKNKGKNMTGEDWPAGSFNVVRTSEKVVSGGQAKPKSKNKTVPKKYSQTQESAIAKAMKANPDYSREEIISALKLN